MFKYCYKTSCLIWVTTGTLKEKMCKSINSKVPEITSFDKQEAEQSTAKLN